MSSKENENVPNPYSTPWYIWPLRPIVFWGVFIMLAVLWPLWTFVGFCGLAYLGKACEWAWMRRNNYQGGDWGFWDVVLFPLWLFFILILGSLRAIPII